MKKNFQKVYRIGVFFGGGGVKKDGPAMVGERGKRPAAYTVLWHKYDVVVISILL
jgi:hypothetical protein